MNRFGSPLKPLLWLMAILLAAFVSGCGSGGGDGAIAPGPGAADTTRPTVTSSTPADVAIGVSTHGNITATFSEAMNAATINNATFTLTQGGTLVPATVTYAGKVAILDPTSDLATGTVFTATITTGANDRAGNALAADKTWSFTTNTVAFVAQAPVVLGSAGTFALLTKAAITDIPNSAITGDVGASPITGVAIGVTCAEVTGAIYAVDAAGPAPCSVVNPALLTTAVGDVDTAYVDAAGRVNPDFLNLGAGEIGGLTLVPGLYKWTTNLLISTDVTLSGGPDDVWIFQLDQGLTQANGMKVLLSGGARAKNIFWQTFGVAALGTTAHLEGIVMSASGITLATGASVNGRLFSGTSVTLDHNAVTQPAP